jgi:ABC-type nitrate/sulfonate/bicarbonate transport system ATPase subunit
LVGPSGCGKSTLLAMIAGLETVSEGEIRIGDRLVNSVAPKDRDIAMVFQSYALYPTMTVRENITFGMESRGVPKPQRLEAVARVAALLQIEPLLNRKPGQLSGGQRQRVAMGRALVRDPKLFLFDEPLSNLDAKLRVDMRTEIKKLHHRVGKTTVYVTHDQVEAMTYAGGVSLGWSEPAVLCEEVAQALEGNYKAVKLRGGDTPARDIARVAAVREAFGDDLTIMVDANTNYTVADVLKVLPAFEELGVEWLEEPFAPHDHRSYATADRSNVPLAAGENHYTRFEFHRLIEDGHVGILQPDLSKAGGITEVLRIAALGSAWKLPICPHTATTGLNMAVTIHVLASIDNAGYFEGDISEANLFRDELVSTPYTVAADGTVSPLDRPGIGVDVDEDFARAHPFIDGLAYAETPAQGAR